MNVLLLAVEVGLDSRLLGAVDLARVLQVCVAASRFKQDRYWRPLLRERYPKHPGRRAYRRYCAKANYQRHTAMAQRRKRRFNRLCDDKPWLLYLQRPIKCYACWRGLNGCEHVWTRDPRGQQRQMRGFAAQQQPIDWPTYRPYCPRCCDALAAQPFDEHAERFAPTSRPWRAWPCGRSYAVLQLVHWLRYGKLLRPAARRKLLRGEAWPKRLEAWVSKWQFVGRPLRSCVRGAKRNAKLRWLYRGWRRASSAADRNWCAAALATAKAQRRRHAEAALRRDATGSNPRLGLARLAQQRDG